jgi:acyl-ACP thioesterase
MYSFDSRVRYSEVDDQGKLILNSLLDYFQDASTFHSEDVGRGVNMLKEEDVAWILVSWQIEIERYPVLGEKIKIGTWPYDFNSFYGYRNYQIMDETGKRIAAANSMWVLINVGTGKLTRLKPQLIAGYQIHPPLLMEGRARKIRQPIDLEPKESFKVQRFHLDTNNHVNNSKYILMAQEYLPLDFIVGQMRVEYKKSAVYGDTIYPFLKTEVGKITMVLCDQAKTPFVTLEMEEAHDSIR